jgi:hypothetical protein
MSVAAINLDMLADMVEDLTSVEIADLILQISKAGSLGDSLGIRKAIMKYIDISASRKKIMPFVQSKEEVIKKKEEQIKKQIEYASNKMDEIQKKEREVKSEAQELKRIRKGLQAKPIVIKDLNGLLDKSKNSENKCGVYILKSGELYKIGCSINIPERIKSHATSNPNLEVICIIPSKKGCEAELEKKIHRLFANKRVSGREWFHLVDADIEVLRNLQAVT